MSQFATFGSTQLDPRVVEANAVQPEPEGEFSKGLRAGGLSMMGQGNTLAAEVAKRFNANDFAQGRQAAANDYMLRAAEAAPRVGTYRDVHSLRDAGDYVAGMAGSMIPMAVPAVGAGLLTGGGAVPAMLAGAGVMAPFETGDVLQRQQAEGKPTNLRDAMLSGGASALAQNVVPGMARAKLASGAGRGMLKEVAYTVPEQALASGAGEAVKQAGAGQKFDPAAVTDATVAGGVMGVPFGVMGGLGGHGKAPGEGKGTPSVEPGAGGPSDAPQTPSGAPKTEPSVSEATYAGLKGLGERAQTAARGAMDRVSKGLPADFGKLAELDPTTPEGRAELGKQTQATVEKVKTWGDELAADAGLTPERREKVNQALRDLGSEANQVYIATERAARDKAKQFMSAVDAAHAHLTERAEGAAGNDGHDPKVTAQQIKDIAMPYLRAAPAKARQMAEGAAERLRASSLPDGVKTELEAALKNPGEQANRAYIAAADYVSNTYKGTDWSGLGGNVKALAKSLVRAAAEKGEQGVDLVQAGLDALREKKGLPTSKDAKKSEDYSGIDSKIAEALRPVLAKARPEVLDSNEGINKAASAVRLFMEQVAKKEPGQMSSDMIARLIDVFGEHTTEVLNAAHDAVKSGDRAEAERVFGALNQIDEAQGETRSTLEEMRRGLKHQYRGEFSEPELRELHKHLTDWATRAPDRSQTSLFHDAKINQFIDEHFEKPDKLRGMLEKANEPTELQGSKREIRESDDADFGRMDDALNDSPVQLTRMKEQAVPSPKAHRAEFGNEGQAERWLREIKEKRGDNPEDSVNFRWMSGAEYHALTDTRPPKNMDPGHGYVVAERTEGSDRLSTSGFSKFKFDTKKGDRRTDPAVVDAGEGVLLDGMKLAHKNGEPKDAVKMPGVTERQRMARTLANNVAAITDFLGRRIDIPDSTVVAKWADGSVTKAGELKKLHGSDEGSPAEQIGKLKEQMATADRAETKRLKGEISKLEFKRDAELAGRDEDTTYYELQQSRAKVVAELRAARKGGDTVAAERAMKRGEQIERQMAKMRLDDEVAASGARKDFDPEAQIHEATARASNSEKLEHGFNMDGTPVSHVAVNSPREIMARNKSEAQRGANGGAVAEGKSLPEPNPKPKPVDPVQRQMALEARAARELEAAAKQAGGMTEDHLSFTAGGQRYQVQQLRPGKFIVRDEQGRAVASRGMEAEGSPDPKAVAAKKAVFVERARSGDKALIDEVSKSNDAKGLQRAAEALKGEKGATAAVEAINKRLGELMQNPDTAYGMLTRKYSLEGTGDSHDRQRHLITRLADARRATFEGAAKSGVEANKIGRDSFGPLGRDFTYYFSKDGTHTHTSVIPDSLVPRLEKYLATRSDPGQIANALDFFSAQHVIYDHQTGDVTTFSPHEDSAGAKELARLGALGKANAALSDGTILTRAEGVSARETYNLLATALAYSKHALGKDELPVNWERVTGGNVGKKGGGVFSAERADPNVTHTSTLHSDVARYIDKVLGKSVRLEWASIGHAGDFTRMKTEDVIRVSVHALDPMGTAFHESLHGFFAKLDDVGAKSVKHVIMRAADTAHVRKQLAEFLAGKPEALKQLSDPEERAAYMYQAWALGKLRVGPETNGVLSKVAAYFRKVLGLWSNDERALHIMAHFQSGEFAKIMGDRQAVREAYLEQGRNAALDKAKAMTEPLTRLAETVGTAGGARLRDTGIPALRELADLMKATGRDANGDQGFIPAARTERTAVMNRLGRDLGRYSKAQINEALESMQRGTAPVNTGAKVVRKIVQTELARLKGYMERAGVDVSDLGPNYFPRVYNADYISRHQREFITLLEKYGHANAAGIMHKIVAADGNEFHVETPRPGMQHLKLRKLANIPDAELAKFMSKDTFGILNSYVTQATRRAEWARRFDDNGTKLNKLIERAQREGADNATVDYAKKYVMGVDGTLGDDLNPTARRLMGDMIVYQNVRLLPLAIFSSIVDPVGIMVRGGEVGDAWTTFKRGIKEIPKNFKDAANTKDAATELAETMGVIDNAALVHSLGALYSQGMVGETGRKVNDTFFRYNLMEQFNTSMRVGAMEASLKFIAKHADGKADAHSKRWISELGLQAGDVQPDAQGRPKLTEQDGLTPEQASRMRAAVNRWVDGAVLRPDATDKPVWMNDPHWALVAHLKQFVYSFHETILKRVTHEVEHGNYRPAMAMASYVPVMIASDMVKGLIQGGGQQPDWKDNWGAGDYLWSGVQRAGLLGTGQFIADAGMHTGSLAGPTLEQLTDAVSTLGGREQFKHFAIKSLPANALYATTLGGKATDPAFAD